LADEISRALAYDDLNPALVVGDKTISPTRFFDEEGVWIWTPNRI